MGDFQIKVQPKTYDAVIVGSGAGGGMAAYDLVLKGGHVVDPGQRLDAKMDVAFHAGTGDLDR